jgi:serine/threonine-protein kinase
MSKNKKIVLHGLNRDYIFYPYSSKSFIRKASKFSKVYKGETSENNSVIIKLLPSELAKIPENIESFKNEINWCNTHPNLLAPYEYIEQDGRHYLISDFVQNINIGYYIRYRWKFLQKRIELAIECGLQLLDAVEVMHSKGYIHTDIKPANVLFASNKIGIPYYKNPYFYLIDFGMARKAGQVPAYINKNSKRQFVLVYSPPEMVLGFYDLTSFHSDLYNIAFIIYEMIVKEPVYKSEMSVKVINLQTSYPLSEKKIIPSQLMQILLKAANKHHFKKPPVYYTQSEVYEKTKQAILQRYQTAAEFKKDLIEFKNTYFKICC